MQPLRPVLQSAVPARPRQVRVEYYLALAPFLAFASTAPFGGRSLSVASPCISISGTALLPVDLAVAQQLLLEVARFADLFNIAHALIFLGAFSSIGPLHSLVNSTIRV